MMRRAFITMIASMVGLMLVAFLSAPAKAEQPPRDGCVAVPKIQYDSAKKQNLLENRFGIYVRTGRFLRRRYWYCH